MVQSNKCIGLFGGSFNPIHHGHLIVAQEAYLRFSLDAVHFVPAARNPLKPDASVYAAAEHRLNMLRLAVEGDTRFMIDTSELEAGGVSYTIDTLRRYREAMPSHKVYFLVGSDAARDLHLWKDIGQYPSLCTLLLYDRPGSSSVRDGLTGPSADLGLKVEFLEVPQIEISSTEIRKRLRADEPVRYMVPRNVDRYLSENSLYR